MKKNMGRIFNIQRFSVHDGPGIRTTVFMKGCNLRCKWCHNPESYLGEKQIRYQPEKCVDCGTCKMVCPKGIYVLDRQRVNREACEACGKCVEECLYGALQIWGEDKTVEQIMRELRRDTHYYENSGGGLTVSGGEPLLQADFIRELFEAAQEEGIHTALDTAADVPYEMVEKVLPFTNLVLLDLKIMDGGLHKRYTGVTNERILKNAERLFDSGIPIQIRIPLIKGINDSVENAELVRKFVCGHTGIQEIKLLPYHSMGISKAEQIQMGMEQYKTPDKDRLEQIREVLKQFVKKE